MRFCSYILVVLMSINSVVLAQDYWTFESGSKVLYVNNIASTPLRVKAPRKFNYEFASRVGGVSFEEILQTTAIITLDYDKSKDDGHRLEVVVNGVSYYPTIPDWQLAPIANFASTDYTAAVSLFGNDPTVQVGYNKVVYHDAFENTLLGLRLLQADIMLINVEEYHTLPRHSGNDIIYGHGEEPLVETNIFNLIRVQNFMINNIGEFNSWIFTDKDKILAVDNIINEAAFDEELPYYFFWKTGISWNAEISARIDSMSIKYKEDLNRPLGEFIWNSSDLKDRDTLALNDPKLKLLKLQKVVDNYHMDLNATIDRALNNSITSRRLIEAKEVNNQAINFVYPVLRLLNPAVYRASENTMKFSALFRYVKEQNPTQWLKFMDKIKEVRVEPAIVTPTVFNSSGK